MSVSNGHLLMFKLFSSKFYFKYHYKFCQCEQMVLEKVEPKELFVEVSDADYSAQIKNLQNSFFQTEKFMMLSQNSVTFQIIFDYY